MELIVLGITTLVSVVAGIFKYKDQKKKSRLENDKLTYEIEELKRKNLDYEIKLQFFDRIMDLTAINAISVAVERIFEKTKADRFLILIAKNGKEEFKIVSVIFEQHKNKNYRINAIARYRNVKIDNDYRLVLKQAERFGVVELETATMPESILRDFYEMEGIKFSKIRHLARKPIDGDNDFLVFSSLATHEDKNFTRSGMAYIKTQYEGTILPALNEVLD